MPVGRPAGMNVGLVAALARLVVLTRFNDVLKRLSHGGVGMRLRLRLRLRCRGRG